MIRAVIDTSVLVRGVISRKEPARRILIAIVRGAFDIVVSAESLFELRDVLERQGSTRDWIDQEIVEVIVQTLAQLPVVDIDGIASPVSIRDPEDEYLIRTALAGNATYIVSVDNDVLAVADDLRPLGVEVVTPARFVEVLGG